MGGGGKGSYQQQSSFQPPAWALAGGQQAVQTAQQLAQTPFEVPVQPIAPFSGQQQEAFQEVENSQGMAQPYINAGAGLVAQGANPDISQYFGAESAGVLPQLENVFAQQSAQNTGNLNQTAGGVGASRIGVGQAELANQQGLSAGQTLSQIMGQSVGQAQTGAQLEQQAGSTIAGMGPTAQTAALQGATAELQTGTLQQQQEQNQANAQYENELQQISWPFQTNQYLGSMAAGVTPAMGGTGITSGNVKSSQASTSGLGKGLTALGGAKGSTGGAMYAEGGAVSGTPFDIQLDGPQPMQGGGQPLGNAPVPGAGSEYMGAGPWGPWMPSTNGGPPTSAGAQTYAIQPGESWPGQNWGWAQPAGESPVMMGGPAANAGQGQVANQAVSIANQDAAGSTANTPISMPGTMGQATGNGPVSNAMGQTPSISSMGPQGGSGPQNPWSMLANTAGQQGQASPWFLPMQGLGAMLGPQGASQFGSAVGKGSDGGSFADGGGIRKGYKGGGDIQQPSVGSFSPASGSTVMVPFGPGEGGSQPLTLSDPGSGGSAVPPAPNIHPFAPIQMPSDSGATAPDLSLRGVSGQPGVGPSTPGAINFQGPDFGAMLGHLMNERGALNNQLNSITSGIGKVSAGAMGSAAGAAGAAAGAAHKQGGGEVGGDDSNPFVVPGTNKPLGVSNLLGASQSGVPSVGAAGIIPVSPVQGRPSPQMQDLMKYKGPNPMSVSQAPSGGGGKQQQGGLNSLMSKLMGKGPISSQTAPSQPSSDSTTGGGDPLSAPGAGGKVTGPDVGDTAMSDTDAFDIADASPSAFDMGSFDMGDMFSARGGAIHMDIGGDPSQEIQGTELPYAIESQFYGGNQPTQMAGLDMGDMFIPPTSRQDYQPPAPNANYTGEPFDIQRPVSTPPGTMTQGPPAPQGGPEMTNPFEGSYTDPTTGVTSEGASPDWTLAEPHQGLDPQVKAAYERNTGYRGPDDAPWKGLGFPPVQPVDLEQKGIDTLNQISAKPITPSPPPGGPPTGPKPPAAGGPAAAPGKPPGVPSPAPTGLQKANQALNTPIGQIAKQAGMQLPSLVDGNMTPRQLIEKYPAYKGQLIDMASTKLGINRQDVEDALAGKTGAPQPGPPTAQQAQTADMYSRPGRNADAQAVIDTARRLKMSPELLARIMNIETGFKPWSHNPSGSHVNPGEVAGVIGFDRDNRIKYFGGPELERVTSKSIADQMPMVERYFLDRGWKPGQFDPNDAARAYSIVNHGSLLPGDQPALDKRDSNGTIREHVATITSPRYGREANEFLYGDKSAPATVAAKAGPPTADVPAAAKPYPAAGPERTGPGPNTPYNKTAEALMTLGTGDPDAYLKHKMNQLGYYQESANWDTMREAQYGFQNQTPQQNGVDLANHINQAKDVIGKVHGADELNAHPGTIANAAETGQQGPGGGSVSPAGPTPSGSGAGATPQATTPAPAYTPPRNAHEAAIDRANFMLGSGNPKAMAAGAALLNQIANTGLVDAHTQLARMQSAGVGWRPLGNSNMLVNPVQGLGFIPNKGVFPLNGQSQMGVQPGASAAAAATPGPGIANPAAPSQQGAPPVQPQALPPLFTPQGAPPATPQPLPSGAGPETQRPQAAPQQAAPPAAAEPGWRIESDRSFQVTPPTPDRRAFPYGAPVGPPPTDKDIEDSAKSIDGAQQSNQILAASEREFDRLGPKGIAAPGYAFKQRMEVLSAVNTLMRSLGYQGLGAEDLASGTAVEKLQTQLATTVQRGLGREPGYILQMLKSSMVPGGGMSPEAFHHVVSEIRALNQRTIDRGQEFQTWVGSYQTPVGFDQAFNAANPIAKYDAMGDLGGARTPTGNRMGPAQFEALRRNPANVDSFARAWKVQPDSLNWVATH